MTLFVQQYVITTLVTAERDTCLTQIQTNVSVQQTAVCILLVNLESLKITIIVNHLLAYVLAPICGKNEVYDTCSNGGCSKRNCSQLGKPEICIDVTECIGACVCQDGYFRAKNGTCVPQNQCPSK